MSSKFFIFLLGALLSFSKEAHSREDFHSSVSYPIKQLKTKRGLSIYLYRVKKVASLEQLTNRNKQINRARDKRLNLYKMSADLAMILSNNRDPFNDFYSVPYKMLYGKKANIGSNYGEIGGFLPYTEVEEIVGWIQEKGLDKQEGFFKLYNELSPEVKSDLKDMGTDPPEKLFSGYVQPLVDFYKKALKHRNSILFIGL